MIENFLAGLGIGIGIGVGLIFTILIILIIFMIFAGTDNGTDRTNNDHTRDDIA